LVRRYKASRYYKLLDTARRQILSEALRDHCGNRTHTAKALGLQRSYLLRLIRKLAVKE
jgi:DNA-binding NtrC family response regulator